MKRNVIVMLVSLLAIMALVLTGCTDTNQSGPASTSNEVKTSPKQPVSSPGVTNGNIIASGPTNSTGRLEIKVTDAPAKEEITKIDVSVKSIEIKKVGNEDSQGKGIKEEEGAAENEKEAKDNNGWNIINLKRDASGKYPTFDLLKVKDNPETLTAVYPEVGAYKVRLEVASVMITFGDGKPQAAIVPSGKIRFSSAFEVTQKTDTVLLFDFDAERSVHVTGNGKVMFKPVIKLSVSQAESDSDEETETLNITTEKLPFGVIGVDYNATLKATGGEKPYLWSITSSVKLPKGLTLNEDTGKISGKPVKVAGAEYPKEYKITVKVTDASNTPQSDEQKFTLVVKGVDITTDQLPGGIVDVVYEEFLEAAGGSGDYTWSITSGTLPDGLALAANTGKISESPDEDAEADYPVEYKITVKVKDASDATLVDTRELTLVICQKLEITTDSLPNGTKGIAYKTSENKSVQLKAVEGNLPYTWSITEGNLPDGMTLKADTGVISGIPTELGDFEITVKVTDNSKPTAQTDTQELTIKIVQGEIVED